MEKCILMLKPKFQKSFLKQQVNTTYMHISLKQVLQHKGTSILCTRTATIVKKKIFFEAVVHTQTDSTLPNWNRVGKERNHFPFLKKIKNIHYKSKWQPT